MARYIAKAKAFKKTVATAVTEPQQVSGSPDLLYLRETRPPIIACFSRLGITPRELELAQERFCFKDENPADFVSIFDTDEEAHEHGWSDAVKAQVEDVLDAGEGYVYVKVELDPSPSPWPTYDTTPADDIFPTAELIGVDLKGVLNYERENRNRKAVVDAILGSDAFADPVVVEA